MRSQYLYAVLAALAAYADAVEYCGIQGLSTKLPYFTSASSALKSASSCGKHCATDAKCQSYAVGTGLCLHYSVPVAKALKATSSSPWRLYDRICAPTTPNNTPSSASNGLPATNDGGSATIDIGGVVTSPAIASSDSPPLPSSSVAFPTDDKSFTVTYTYTEDPLPTIVAMGSAPIDGLAAPTTGLPELPCVIDPSLTTNQFNILGSNFVPLVSAAGGKLQPLPAPTSEAQATAMGPPDAVALPSFYFQKAAGAPVGIFDIVMAGPTPQYVAKASNGGVVLTTSSTGPNAKTVRGQSIVTSIFGVDCKGRISVKQGTTQYTWDVTADGTSTAFTSGVSSSNKTMVTYTMQMKAKAARNRRRSIWTEGSAPRCPNTPNGLHAAVFPGARGLNPNGCGPANGIDFVPDFSFGSCCDGHDNCFDNCNAGTFEGCNNAFHDCMRGTGCDYLDHWYSYIPYLACLKAADFYYWAVGTSIGRDAFYSANKERCRCYCPSQLALCAVGDGIQCNDLFGSDVNNCGACGRTCSAKAACKKGSCSCPADQCGDRCLSLANNPNHCGSCNNKCDAGYDCYQGQCYLPPPDKCIPVEGFTNGDSVETWNRCPYRCDQDGFTDPLCPYYTGSRTPGWKIGANAYGSIGTTVKMCPGTDYQLSFSTNHADGLGINCKVQWKFGNRSWSPLQGIPTPDDSRYHRSPTYDVPAFQLGDSGTTLNGLSLDVPFAVQMTCDGVTYSTSIDFFSLQPA